MPKVPQLVPVAKASRQPMTNTMRRQQHLHTAAALLQTKSRTKYLAPRESVMAFRLQAKVRIMMAGTMALKPSGMQSIMSWKVMDAADHVVDEGEHQGKGGAQHQAHGGVGAGEGVHEIRPRRRSRRSRSCR